MHKNPAKALDAEHLHRAWCSRGVQNIQHENYFHQPAMSDLAQLVAYVDGSVLAQLGSPDMRTPIAYTLAWPQRMASPMFLLGQSCRKFSRSTLPPPVPET